MNTETSVTITPPTFAAYPTDGGPLHVARPKVGEWDCGPKFNGWALMVNPPTGLAWNRHGKPSSIAHEFSEALDKLKACPFGWLHCEALERRHGIGRGSLIILDAILPDSVYLQRRELLEKFFHINTGPELMGENEVSLAPSMAWPEAEGMWRTMQKVNERVGCQFYEGLVAKKLNSPYPFQLRSSSERTRFWVKHRWSF